MLKNPFISYFKCLTVTCMLQYCRHGKEIVTYLKDDYWVFIAMVILLVMAFIMNQLLCRSYLT